MVSSVSLQTPQKRTNCGSTDQTVQKQQRIKAAHKKTSTVGRSVEKGSKPIMTGGRSPLLNEHAPLFTLVFGWLNRATYKRERKKMGCRVTPFSPSKVRHGSRKERKRRKRWATHSLSLFSGGNCPLRYRFMQMAAIIV